MHITNLDAHFEMLHFLEPLESVSAGLLVPYNQRTHTSSHCIWFWLTENVKYEWNKHDEEPPTKRSLLHRLRTELGIV